MKLKVGSRFTHAHDVLLAGQTVEGASVTRRQKGFSDFDVFRNLLRLGWLEGRAVGPRGGIKYFTTAAGVSAVNNSTIL